MKTCICDKCKAEIQINIQEKMIENKKGDPITEQFFICPACGEKYIICIWDNIMRKRMKIRKSLSKSKYNMNRDKKIKNEMKDHFEKLRKEYKDQDK